MSEMNEVTVKGIESLDELNGFEVVRTDIISAYHKAKITLDYDAIKFSKACLDLFPKNEFVQVLIDRVRKRIVLLPCDKYTKDALKWCSTKDGKHISRDCTARIFRREGIRYDELDKGQPLQVYRDLSRIAGNAADYFQP